MEALNEGLARKLSRLEIYNCLLSQKQFNKILSNLDPKKITSLTMISSVNGNSIGQYAVFDREEDHKQAKMTCHFISAFVKLKDLKISFEYICDKWFQMMGDTLIAMGSKLRTLHLLLNGEIDNNCAPFQ